MGLHANGDCPHGDPITWNVRRLHDVGDPKGVLREIAQLREDGVELDTKQRITVQLHEQGARLATRLISLEEFLDALKPIMAEVAAMEDYYTLADIQMWRVYQMALANRTGLARQAIAEFLVDIPRTPHLEAYQGVAQAFLAEHEGDDAAVLKICREAMRKFNRTDMPCIYELLAAQFARAMQRLNQPMAARDTLRGANIPEDRIEARLALPA